MIDITMRELYVSYPPSNNQRINALTKSANYSEDDFTLRGPFIAL